MSKRTLAEKYNKSTSNFYVMKIMNPDKYRFIFGFSENPEKSLRLYLEYVTDLQHNLLKLCQTIPTKYLRTLIAEVGYCESSIYMVLKQLYKVIDEDNFTTIKLEQIHRHIALTEIATKWCEEHPTLLKVI